MTRKNRILNFNKICRTCLCERNDLKPLFSACLADMLMICASVEVAADDGLPSNVCVTCFHQISRYASFKTKIEKSDLHLRKYLKDLQKNRSQNKSIIAQAATDADIDITNDGYQDQEKDSSESDDDVKLSVRQMKLKINFTKKRQPRQAKSKANVKIENLKANYIVESETIIPESVDEPETIIPHSIGNIELFDHSESFSVSHKNDKFETDFKEDEIHLVTQIFTDGPPPLVPLIPIQSDQIPDFPADTNIAPAEVALKPISNETPPLIPIKQLSFNSVTLVSTLDSRIQQQLKYVCSTCNEEFSSPIDLKHHILSLHSNTSALICNICRKEFSDRKRLIGHLKGHMVVKHYACKLCGKRYPNPSTFKVHMRSHTGERPFKCQICNKGFIRWAGVVGHMKSHNANKPYTCDICQKGFKIASNLERHKILHTGSMPFCCSYCGKTFSQSDNLQLHVRTYHTHERPYLCSECGKGFVSSTRLNRHMWVHSGYKPYVCKTCNKAYSNSNDLKNHEKTHNGGPCDADKPYICITCNMRFFHPCRLMKHMKTHEKPYACPECMKTFSREEILNKHIINKHGGVSLAQNVHIDTDHLDNHIYTITNY